MPPKKKPAVPSQNPRPRKPRRSTFQPAKAAERLEAEKFEFMFAHSTTAKSITLLGGEMNANQAFV